MADPWETFLIRFTAPQPPAQSHAGGSGGGARMGAYRDAIAAIESRGSGDYAAIGPTNSRLGRAMGRYQIMEANIGPWSRQALGREVSPSEFLANPGLQDAIFDHVFGGYVDRYGEEGAAQAWFGGPGAVGRTQRQDVLGTTVGGYGQRFVRELSQGRGGGAPSMAGPDPAPRHSPATFNPGRLWLDMRT